MNVFGNKDCKSPLYFNRIYSKFLIVEAMKVLS